MVRVGIEEEIDREIETFIGVKLLSFKLDSD